MPASVGIALFITEVAPGWLRGRSSTLIDLLAVVPSVVFGLWGVLVLADPIKGFYDEVSKVLAPIPIIGKLFEGPTSGRRLLHRRDHPRPHDRADHHLDHP